MSLVVCDYEDSMHSRTEIHASSSPGLSQTLMWAKVRAPWCAAQRARPSTSSSSHPARVLTASSHHQEDHRIAAPALSKCHELAVPSTLCSRCQGTDLKGRRVPVSCSAWTASRNKVLSQLLRRVWQVVDTSQVQRQRDKQLGVRCQRQLHTDPPRTRLYPGRRSCNPEAQPCVKRLVHDRKCLLCTVCIQERQEPDHATIPSHTLWVPSPNR